MTDVNYAVTLAGRHIVILHLWSLASFGQLTASLLCQVLAFPTQPTEAQLPDALPVIGTLLAATTFSLLCLKSRLVRRTVAREKAGAVLLLSSSATAFVYFQYYHDAFARSFYILALGLVGAYAAFVTWQRTVNFVNICVIYAGFALAPAVHASLGPTAGTPNLAGCFILFLSANAVGGLLYAWRMPGRFSGLAGSAFSELLMHGCAIFATTHWLKALMGAHTFTGGVL